MKNIFKAICLILAMSGCVSCQKKHDSQIHPINRLEYHDFDFSSSLAERIKLMPEGVLDVYRQRDNRQDYKAYNPSSADKALVLEYLSFLPPIYKKVFRENCAAIYFVENFMGNGMADWALDKDNNIYFHIALNPASLKDSLSKTLTERERSCFIPTPGISVNVDAGIKYKGLAYALFHEATHAVDYVKGITPFADKDFPRKYWPRRNYKGNMFFNIWKDYFIPLKNMDFKGRDKITFYGLSGGPKLRIKEAPLLYSGLVSSPFISLYGSKSWAEDLAELVSFQMITGKLGQPYIITLRGFGQNLIIKPMSSDKRKRGAEIMKILESISLD